ncbi:hypothetical protein M408DRAFT_228196 [Serendipita vermifera MAFF 305830]|uniref:Mediator of RNA polymerase II transcription subunit 8 n=1 Tax=Serendipita vermifera MAFF 305830 TaxID=933852 RepID=A0A0C3AJV2_SERVB|nr:hypothetical protein M408DRAFT_228196 [Serendipita vermifera MAFF 305830]
MNTALFAPASAPVPQMSFDPSSLPLPHLVSLRSKLSQIIDSLNNLTLLIAGNDVNALGMASWPDILAKYTNLLTQSQSLMTTLSGAHLPQPARRPGEARRERGNPYEGIVLHPFLLTSPDTAAATTTSGTAATSAVDEAHQGMLENLLRTDPHPEVIKRWDASVRRFVERRKGGDVTLRTAGDGTGAGVGGLALLGGIDPAREAQDIIKEMTGVREGHDARIERAMRVVEELRDRWDWKMRVGVEEEDLFGDNEGEEGGGGGAGANPTQSSVGTGMLLDDGDTGMGTQTQSILGSQSQSQTVHMDTQSQPSRMDTQTSVLSGQPPPPTQHTAADDEEDMFSASDDDDDDDLEDVMED